MPIYNYIFFQNNELKDQKKKRNLFSFLLNTIEKVTSKFFNGLVKFNKKSKTHESSIYKAEKQIYEKKISVYQPVQTKKTFFGQLSKKCRKRKIKSSGKQGITSVLDIDER